MYNFDFIYLTLQIIVEILNNVSSGGYFVSIFLFFYFILFSYSKLFHLWGCLIKRTARGVFLSDELKNNNQKVNTPPFFFTSSWRVCLLYLFLFIPPQFHAMPAHFVRKYASYHISGQTTNAFYCPGLFCTWISTDEF